MSNSKKITAKIKATGETIHVYALARGGYCNWNDCKTEYTPEQLQILSK